MAAKERYLSPRVEGRHTNRKASIPKSMDGDNAICGFTAIEMIGEGGYGTVWKAIHKAKGSFAAIKKIDLSADITYDDIDSFMMEIDLLKVLNHNNIVRYIGHKIQKNCISIVMEYVENGSLADMVRHHGSFPERLVAVYLAQVLKGLVYLHDQGVIHRDIKGANILVSTDGSIKLADFGVATKLSDMRREDSVAGSPYWMAPELIALGGFSAACDIWSVGCTAIELLTGNPPYFELQPAAALYRIFTDDHPPLPSGVSKRAKDFLMQCFQKDVNLRIEGKKLFKHSWLKEARLTLKESGRLDTLLRSSVHEIQRYQNALKAFQRGGMDNGPHDDHRDASPVKEEKTLRGHRTGSERSLSPNHIQVHRKKRRQAPQHPRKDNKLDLDRWKEIPEDHAVDTDFGTSNYESLVGSPTTGGFHGRIAINNRELRDSLANLDDHNGGTTRGSLPRSRQHSMNSVFETLQLTKFEEVDDDDFGDGIDFGDEFEDIGQDFHGKLQANLEARTASYAPDTLDTLDEMQADDGEDDDFGGINIYREKCLVDFNKKMALLESVEESQDIIDTCKDLIQILNGMQIGDSTFLLKANYIPLVDHLKSRDLKVVYQVFKLVNAMISCNSKCAMNMCLMGGIPVIIKYTDSKSSKEIRKESARIIKVICSRRISTLQMFIACDALSTLVDMLDENYKEFRSIVHYSIESLWSIFKLQDKAPKKAFCRLLVRSDLLQRLATTLVNLAIDKKARIAKKKNLGRLPAYIDHVTSILSYISQSDADVKKSMCREDTLTPIQRILEGNQIDDTLLLKLLKILKNLCLDTTTRDKVAELNYIQTLVGILDRKKGCKKEHEIANQTISCLYYLLQFNRIHQSIAAEAGVIPHLIGPTNKESGDPGYVLRNLTLPILLDFPSTSDRVRKMLWNHDCLKLYVSLLKDNCYYVDALDALSNWMTFEHKKVGREFAKPENASCIVSAFILGHQTNNIGGHKVSEPIQLIVSKSHHVNQSLFKQNFVSVLLAQILQNPNLESLAKLNILKIVNLLFVEHKRHSDLVQKYGAALRKIVQNARSILVVNMVKRLLREGSSE